jgi:A/G-specific adenine glycosylase
VSVDSRICTIKHAYSHFSITLTAYWCTLDGDRDQIACERPWQWVRPEQFQTFPFPIANHKIFRKLGLPGFET